MIRTAKGLAVLAALGLSVAQAATAELPLDMTYARYFDITVNDSVPETLLANFPILVTLDAQKIPGFYGWHSLSNGGDLRFTDEYGNDLPYDIDTWNPDGVSKVWVRTVTLNPGMKIRCHYGKLDVSNASDIWAGAGYRGVYHMGGTDAQSPVPNAVQANGLGTLTVDKGSGGDLSLFNVVNGPVGAARNTGYEKTKKAGNYFQIPAYEGVGSVFTVSGWFKLNSSEGIGSARVFSRKNDWGDSDGFEIEMQGATGVGTRGANGGTVGATVPDLSEDWVHLVFKFDNTKLTVYGNGEVAIRDRDIAPATDNGRPLAIGGNATGWENAFAGAVDEVRLYGGTVSDDWVRESYRTVTAADYLEYSPADDAAGLGVAVSDPLVVSNLTTDSLVANLNLRYLGDVSSVTLEVEANVQGAFEETSAVYFIKDDATLGPNAIAVTGLRPGRVYELKTTAVAGDTRSPIAGTVVVRTPTAASLTVDPAQPGLWQAKFRATADNLFGKDEAIGYEDVMEVPEGSGEFERHLEPGAVMVYETNGHDYQSAFSGLSSRWANLHNFLYQGAMYLKAGEYLFKGDFDDYTYLELDGETVLKTVSCDGASMAWVCGTTGWHAIKLGAGDSGGGAGPRNGVGLTYSYNEGDPQRFLDDGDGSLFRSSLPARPIQVTRYGISNGVLTATVSVGEDATVPADGTLSVTAGDISATVGTVTAEATELTWTGLTDAGTGTKTASFRLTSANGAQSVAATIPLPDPTRPQLNETPTGDFSSGTTAVISGWLVSAGLGADGAPAETAEILVRVGRTPDLSDEETTFSYPQDETGDVYLLPVRVGEAFSVSIAMPETDTTYYWQVIAIAANGVEDVTPIYASWMEGSAALSSEVSASETGFVGTFDGELDRVGAGAAATVMLWTGASESSLTNTATLVMNAAGKFSFPVTFPFTNEKVYYQFRVSNDCNGETLTSATSVFSIDLQDRLTYVWTGAGDTPNWCDPANWVASDTRGTYPNSTLCTADFRAVSEAVVELPQDISVKRLDLEKKALSVTLKNTARDQSVLKVTELTTAEGLAFTLDGLYFSYAGVPFKKNMRFTLDNKATFETWSETQLHADGAILEVKGQSQYLHTDWTLSLNGVGSKFILDDSYFRAYNGSIWLSRNTGGKDNVVEIRGANPRIECRGLLVGRDGKSDTPPQVVFFVPAGGYTVAPFTWINQNEGFAAGGKEQTLNLTVSPDSPGLASGKMTTRLVDWKGTAKIEKDFIDTSLQPKANQLTFFYSYGADGNVEPSTEGEKPSSLWFKYRNSGMAISIQ